MSASPMIAVCITMTSFTSRIGAVTKSSSHNLRGSSEKIDVIENEVLGQIVERLQSRVAQDPRNIFTGAGGNWGERSS
jgi:hypothetical protein